MTSKLSFSKGRSRRRNSSRIWWLLRRARLCCVAAVAPFAALSAHAANDAPVWMHTVAGAPLPAHDEKDSGVVLYADDALVVQSNGKIKRTIRRAYKILRPDGRYLGKQHFFYDLETKITSIHGWCIPASGRDFEVKEKDMTDSGYLDVEGGELYSDFHAKVMNIPAADPGNIIGYEIEQDYRPYVLADEWFF